jgi:plastocyanin
MTRKLIALSSLAAALTLAASAGAANPVTVTIRHQLKGCHAWAVGNGPYRATQSLTIAKGSTVRFVDNDVMSHMLMQLTGPKVAVVGQTMAKIGASAHIRFAKAGTYVFATMAGEDYMKGVTTIGEDNVLRLVVTVK